MPHVKERPKHIARRPVSAKIPVKKQESRTQDESVIIPKEEIKKTIEIEETLPLLDTDEKLESDAPLVDSESEIESDELELDEEEINPFGDKWEQ